MSAENMPCGFPSEAEGISRLKKQIRSQEPSADLIRIVALSHELKADSTVVSYSDFGAGKHDQGPGQVTRTVGDLARISSRTPQEGFLLHQLIRIIQPEIAIELGTHLGIGSLYQMSAAPTCRFITLEGAKELGQLARQNWDRSGIFPLPELHIGQFDDILPSLLKSGIRLDYALIDGNHRFEPTIRYFDWIFDRMEEGGMIVLDDIYWSRGMKRAWDLIRKRNDLSLAIDMYQFGIVQKGDRSVRTWCL